MHLLFPFIEKDLPEPIRSIYVKQKFNSKIWLHHFDLALSSFLLLPQVIQNSW